MKSIVRFLVIALLAISAAARADTAAMILDVGGDVRILHGGKETTADIAASVPAGSQLRLAKGAQVTLVHYAARSQIAATGPAMLAIEPQRVRGISGNAPQVRPLPEQRAAAAQGFQGRVVPAALVMKVAGMALPPALQSPVEGDVILGTSPRFAWTTEAAGDFRLELLQGERVLYAAAVAGGAAELPSHIALLHGEHYRWRLLPADESKALAATAAFSVASREVESRLAALRPGKPANRADWVLYAMALEQARAVTAAREVWKTLAAQRPGSTQLKQFAE